MIVFGWRILILKYFKIENVKCPICNNYDTIVFSVLCKIYHFFFIPFFPDKRYVHAVCEHCGENLDDIDFEKEERKIFDIKQYKEKAPIYSWIGLVLTILAITYLSIK